MGFFPQQSRFDRTCRAATAVRMAGSAARSIARHRSGFEPKHGALR
jgi:hypothetical protein